MPTVEQQHDPQDPPSDEVVDRLLAETGGNPLALLELPAELKADQLSGTMPLPSRLALTTRVERAFLDRRWRACLLTPSTCAWHPPSDLPAGRDDAAPVRPEGSSMRHTLHPSPVAGSLPGLRQLPSGRVVVHHISN
jgi:hypothetical protein